MFSKDSGVCSRKYEGRVASAGRRHVQSLQKLFKESGTLASCFADAPHLQPPFHNVSGQVGKLLFPCGPMLLTCPEIQSRRTPFIMERKTFGPGAERIPQHVCYR